MERKHAPLYGIKGKLISAVCMLLVAVIMVVSSTYAWFTLSTAPEVSGISTAIGANGALEIKLNGENDGGKRNNEFGNIVDLSDASYGLSNITLLPSRLALTEGVLANSLLQFPTYGSDGRIEENFGNAQIGVFENSSFKEGTATGVRGVGSVSGLTDRQAAYRSARSTANTSMTIAKNKATASLNDKGSALGEIVIKKATGDGSEKYTQTELASLEAIVTDLSTTVLPRIEEAYLAQLKALAASKASDTAADVFNQDDANEEVTGDMVYLALSAAIGATGNTLSDIGSSGAIQVNGYSVSVTGSLLTGIQAYNTTKSNLDAAQGKIDELQTAGSNDMSWQDFAAVLNYLMNYDYVEVNDLSTDEIRADKNKLAQAVLNANGQVTVTMISGAGVYADVADQCGNYSATITLAEVSVGSTSLQNVKATMNTGTTVNPCFLSAGLGVIQSIGEPVGDTTGGAITEFYGFVIDLIFQTNAANSDLLLQTAPQNRIYADSNKNDQIMGKGSTMTFESTRPSELDSDQVKALMDNIRIVFFTTEGTTILGYAKLDANNAEVGSDGVTANMYMYDVVKTYTYTAEDDSKVTVYKAEGSDTYYTTATLVDNNAEDAIDSKDVKLETEAAIPADVTPTLDTAAEDMYLLKADKSAITSLAQNTPIKISTLVYLDGENLENANVAATATTSMTGKMNIQFSSSANLVPMKYGNLEEGVATEASSETATEAPTPGN